ncbi:MAG: hypothetical protein ACP5XB_00085 [Isosphaeraceae bacterium]
MRLHPSPFKNERARRLAAGVLVALLIGFNVPQATRWRAPRPQAAMCRLAHVTRAGSM